MDGAEFLSLLFIALSLSADCFAVALGGCVSIAKLKYIQVFRTALAFGAAQSIMPLIGWLIGSTVINFIVGFDHWVAFGLLSAVGGRMIWEAFHEKDANQKSVDITRGILLFTLALATSIDSLAVGLSFAFIQVNILSACLIIGTTAFIITNLGFYLGRKAGHVLGQRAKIAGGIILIGIGLRVLLSHLLG
jgi:manganese efflux pump family protein